MPTQPALLSNVHRAPAHLPKKAIYKKDHPTRRKALYAVGGMMKKTQEFVNFLDTLAEGELYVNSIDRPPHAPPPKTVCFQVKEGTSGTQGIARPPLKKLLHCYPTTVCYPGHPEGEKRWSYFKYLPGLEGGHSFGIHPDMVERYHKETGTWPDSPFKKGFNHVSTIYHHNVPLLLVPGCLSVPPTHWMPRKSLNDNFSVVRTKCWLIVGQRCPLSFVSTVIFHGPQNEAEELISRGEISCSAHMFLLWC